MPSFSSYFHVCMVSPIPRVQGTVWYDPRTHGFWGVHQADSDGRPDRRLEDKLPCYGCGPASRFKYIMTTDRRDRLQHGRRCTHSSRVFSATHQYLEDSANRLVFHPPPTQRDLETTYRRAKWFNGLVNRGVLGEPAAEGPPAAFLMEATLYYAGCAVRWYKPYLNFSICSRRFRSKEELPEDRKLIQCQSSVRLFVGDRRKDRK